MRWRKLIALFLTIQKGVANSSKIKRKKKEGCCCLKKKKQQRYKRNTFKVWKQVIPTIGLRGTQNSLNFFFFFFFFFFFLLFQNTVYVARIHVYFKFTNTLISLKFPTQWHLNYSIKWWVSVQILLWRKIYTSSWEYTLAHVLCILLCGYFLHSSLWKKW